MPPVVNFKPQRRKERRELNFTYPTFVQKNPKYHSASIAYSIEHYWQAHTCFFSKRK